MGIRGGSMVVLQNLSHGEGENELCKAKRWLLKWVHFYTLLPPSKRLHCASTAVLGKEGDGV